MGKQSFQRLERTYRKKAKEVLILCLSVVSPLRKNSMRPRTTLKLIFTVGIIASCTLANVKSLFSKLLVEFVLLGHQLIEVE